MVRDKVQRLKKIKHQIERGNVSWKGIKRKHPCKSSQPLENEEDWLHIPSPRTVLLHSTDEYRAWVIRKDRRKEKNALKAMLGVLHAELGMLRDKVQRLKAVGFTFKAGNLRVG